ncbi:MAG: hypothetical protein JJ913_03685 [Rhizobiaceae bacterium]|nr:hypothetical protein [Rhizobiaceae bacterium]
MSQDFPPFDPKAFQKEIEDHFRAVMGDAEFEHSLISQAAMKLARTESARSIGIVWGSTLETTLELAIRRNLTIDGRLEDRAAFMFKPSGPLGSFSNKIDLGAFLNLYNETVWRELVTVKDVRNAFAHKFEADSFESQQISALVNNLCFIDNFIRHKDGMTHIEHSTYTKAKTSAGYRENPLATHKDRFMRTCEFYNHCLVNARPGRPFPDLHFSPHAAWREGFREESH